MTMTMMTIKIILLNLRQFVVSTIWKIVICNVKKNVKLKFMPGDQKWKRIIRLRTHADG